MTTVLTLQPDGAAGIDTYLTDVGAQQPYNWGISTGISIGNGAGGLTYRGLIKFDVSSIPAGSIIQSAILRTRIGFANTSTGFDHQIRRSLVQWYEGNSDGAAPGAGVDASTWDHRNANGSVAWSGGEGGAAGADFSSAVTDTQSLGALFEFDNWDVTADVEAFINGGITNHGWWIGTLAGFQDNSYKILYSSDSTSAASRPQLTVTYIDPGEMFGSFAGSSSAAGTVVSSTIAGSFAGVAAFSGAMPAQEMSGSFAGAVADFSGAIVGWGLMSGAVAGEAAFDGALATQEMAGSFAGIALFSGGGRAVSLPKVPVWTAIVGPTTYSLSGGNPFYRLQATGLGISNIRNIKQRGPFQDGATRRDFRLDERFLNLVFLLQGATRAQADTYRDTLIEIFKPLTDTPCQIRVTRDDGVIKQIDTYAVGVLDLPETEGERFAATQRVLVQLEAPNPIWYGPTLQNLGFTSVLGGTEGFAVPMMIPWAQQPGEYINATESFYYEGNWKEYPVIVITGPAVDAKITNLVTNEKIDFAGYTIAAGDTRTIDLRFGTKTVKNAAGVLKNNELTTDSNLGTFHLAASPEATGGINDIKVEILSGGTTATRVSMMFYNRYIHL